MRTTKATFSSSSTTRIRGRIAAVWPEKIEVAWRVPVGPMNACRARRHWRTTSTPNEGSLWIPDARDGAPAIRRLAMALTPSGNPRDSCIDVTEPPVTLRLHEHHSPLPSGRIEPKPARPGADRSLRHRSRPHCVQRRRQQRGNETDDGEVIDFKIVRLVVLGVPEVLVQARIEVASPRSQRRSAGRFLRWQATCWCPRRLRRQFESPSRTQAMRQPAAKGRVPWRIR